MSLRMHANCAPVFMCLRALSSLTYDTALQALSAADIL